MGSTLRPQQTAEPFSRNAQVWVRPMLTAVNVSPSGGEACVMPVSNPSRTRSRRPAVCTGGCCPVLSQSQRPALHTDSPERSRRPSRWRRRLRAVRTSPPAKTEDGHEALVLPAVTTDRSRCRPSRRLFLSSLRAQVCAFPLLMAMNRSSYGGEAWPLYVLISAEVGSRLLPQHMARPSICRAKGACVSSSRC